MTACTAISAGLAPLPLAPRLGWSRGASRIPCASVEKDEQLMVRVQAGDEGALEALIDRWRAPLYGFLHRRSEPAAVDDLFQESWIRVARASQRFDPKRRFSTWLFQR